MDDSNHRRKVLLWAAASAATVCTAVLIAIALTPQLKPIPAERITPVMPIITEQPSPDETTNSH